MSRKIAIVGATMEGFLQLALLLNNRRYNGVENYSDDEFTLIHDPDKVYPYMLSGVGVAFQESLEREIFFTKKWLEKYCDGVDSCGYKYIGWGNRRDKNFMVTGCSNTFNIEKFRQKFIDDGGDIWGPNVIIKEQRIDSFEAGMDACIINGDEYDYVIDCTEKLPLGYDQDYMTPSVQFTNSAIIFEKYQPGDWNYTIEYAAKYGHIVGMPLGNMQRWCYLYDSNICGRDEIEEDFATIFPDEKYNSYHTDWQPKISNYVIHPTNKRYMRNGNALITIEPGSPGTSAESSFIIGEQICRYLYNDNARDREEHDHMLQITYTNYIIQTLQSFVCFSYQYGSRHDTEYWVNAQKNAVEYLNSPCFVHPAVFAGKDFLDVMVSEEFTEEDYRIAHHKQNAEGGQQLPYDWMNNSNMFYEYAIGLGAPYAKYLKTLGNVEPPEEFGTIGYDCV
tara:strand:- start:629 stop:1975 length:1347 start_codon:yes stop_codon:yes gene_type:complete